MSSDADALRHLPLCRHARTCSGHPRSPSASPAPAYRAMPQDVDARNKSGHDGRGNRGDTGDSDGPCRRGERRAANFAGTGGERASPGCAAILARSTQEAPAARGKCGLATAPLPQPRLQNMPLYLPRRAPRQLLHRHEMHLLGQLVVGDPAPAHFDHVVGGQRFVGSSRRTPPAPRPSGRRACAPRRRRRFAHPPGCAVRSRRGRCSRRPT